MRVSIRPARISGSRVRFLMVVGATVAMAVVGFSSLAAADSADTGAPLVTASTGWQSTVPGGDSIADDPIVPPVDCTDSMGWQGLPACIDSVGWQ